MANFKVKVVEVGGEAPLMLEEKMIILFNDTVPQDLKDIAVIHDGTDWDVELQAGDEMVIGNDAFKLLFVGDKANETLKELGHATFAFNGDAHSDLPGTICLEDKPVPEIDLGTVIEFRRN